MQIKITHLTSVHPRYDIRIFIKVCSSLAKNTCYSVSLIVADGQGNETKNHIHIIDVGKLSGRISRLLRTTKKVYQKALELDSEIYHLHDPELIPIGLKLKKRGKKVIFDAHEDLPKQILGKPYLRPWQAKALAFILEKYERYALQKFSGIIAATPFIRDKFLSIHNNSVDVNNFPLLEEFFETKDSFEIHKKADNVCYVGGLSKIRGVKEIISAMEKVQQPVRLLLAGNFDDQVFKQEVRKMAGWPLIEELGYINREGVRDVLKNSIAGLVTLHPVINYRDSLPIKMFEYMSAGIPVIASNFTLWKRLIEGNNCGICVDPLDPGAIAEAIDYLILNPGVAIEMGRNGRQAVEDLYNWGLEEKKLFEFYENINSFILRA